MSSSMHTGGCLCGSVRYAAAGEVKDLCVCHCQSCRRATGGLMVPWGTVSPSRFTVTRGQLAEFRSSPEVVRGFCASCGTTLTYRHARRAEEVDFALTTLDDADQLVPEAHIWMHDKLAWEANTSSLPEFDTVRAGPPTPSRRVPAGWHAVTPRIFVADADALIAFLADVFGATSERRDSGPSEVRIGDSIVMVNEAGARPVAPSFLYVYVADVDEAYRRALAAGARSLEAPFDLPYGDRRFMVEDRWGNTWQVATRLAK